MMVYYLYIVYGKSLIDDPACFPLVDMEFEGLAGKAYMPFVYANHAKCVRITGNGSLEGNGARCWKLVREKALTYPRPYLVCFHHCQDVTIDHILLQNSPFWTVHPLYCDHVTISRVTIRNPFDSPNTDGIDPDSSRNVLIEGCLIDVGDDCIAIKAQEGAGFFLRNGKDIRFFNVHIENAKGSAVDADGSVHWKNEALCFACQTSRTITREETNMMIVACDGSGEYATIQAAVDAAITGGHIHIRKGLYHEKLHITKDNLLITGDSAESTILWNSDYAKQKDADGSEKGTFLSYTLIITGNNVEFHNITVRNDAGPGHEVGQAVAVYAAGDKAVFRDCRMVANQDTLFCGPTFQKVCDNALPKILPVQSYCAGDPDPLLNRQYYERCTIQGDVDFIFGPYICWFEQCTLICNDRDQEVNGYYTAANTPKELPYGFVFHRCRLTGDCKEGTVYLGRPWRAFARTVFLDCSMDACVHPKGWSDWGDKPVTNRYAEYGTIGARSDLSMRHSGAKRLSREEAECITIKNVLGDKDGWDPQTSPVAFPVKMY